MWLSPFYGLKEMLLASEESFISKFPPIWIYLSKALQEPDSWLGLVRKCMTRKPRPK